MTIFRNFLQHISIHPTLFFFVIIAFFTGTIVDYLLIISIVFIHELGHYVAALFFQWRIERIVLWVFGGVLKTAEMNQRPLYEEFVVTLFGPLQHVVLYGVFYLLLICNIFSESLYSLALFYNTIILLFNLLPIFPLDGGKLLFFIQSSILPFKRAHVATIVCSMSVILFIILLELTLLQFTFSAIIIMVFLFVENWLEWKNRTFIFMRFLLYRYYEPLSFKKSMIIIVDKDARLIDGFQRFRRTRYNYLCVHGAKNYLSEKKSLELYFKEGKLTESVYYLLDSQSK